MNFIDSNIEDNTEGYSHIPEALLIQLQKDYPNQLPEEDIKSFDLGVLVGMQKIIQRLISENEHNKSE